MCGTSDGACQVFHGGALRPSGLILGVHWNVCRIECILEWKQDEVNTQSALHLPLEMRARVDNMLRALLVDR